MTTQIQLSEDAFAAIFRPVANHLKTNASYDLGQGYGTLFETYGEDFAYVMSQPPSHVWTLLYGEGDAIVSGCHFVNRLGYFITEVPVPANLAIEVPMAEPDEDVDTQPLPLRVDASVRSVVDYLWEDERRDYHATDPCARRLHIFRSLSTLRSWLETQESMATQVAGRVAQ